MSKLYNTKFKPTKVGVVKFLVDKAVKALPRSKKVSPTIKSVKPTKLSVKESLKKTRGDEYSKRIKKLDEGQQKVKKGRKLMKEGQKIRKGMRETGTAFQFRDKKSYHALAPGDKEKYKIKKGIARGD